MAMPVVKASLQPMPEPQRMRIATATSLSVHAVVLLLIGIVGAREAARPHAFVPIEVTIERPAREAEVTVKPQPASQTPKATVFPGGGSRRGVAKRNPSSVTPARPPTARPASNAGGRRKAAPAPPNLLTSKAGKTPAGSVGRGSAPSGPGGEAEAAGEGPSYGPGTRGGSDPIYPKHALDQALEGVVTLAVTVGTKGEVQGVAVASSSGHPLLDQAAVRAVNRWTFAPGMTKGVPAAGTVKVTFRFAAGAVTRG